MVSRVFSEGDKLRSSVGVKELIKLTHCYDKIVFLWLKRFVNDGILYPYNRKRKNKQNHFRCPLGSTFGGSPKRVLGEVKGSSTEESQKRDRALLP